MKVSAESAGYMELANAKKDAGCSKVDVEGGVSRNLGCCNLYERQKPTTDRFNCGHCEYVQIKNFGSRIGAQ